MTQQRSTGSKTRFSCSHVHEKNTHPCKQGFEKKGATQTDAENMENSGDKTDRATMRSTTHTSNCVCVQTKKGEDKTVEFSTKEPRIPENMVGTKNTNNCNLVHSCRTRPWIVHTIRDKNFDLLGKVRMLKETQKLSHTEGRKINIHIDKMSRPCRHITKHGSFHIGRVSDTCSN